MSNDDLQRVWQAVIAIGLAVAAVGGFFSYHYGKNADDEEKARNAHAGTLRPAHEPGRLAPLRPEIEIGDSGAVFIFGGPQGAPIFRLFEDDSLAIALDEKGRICVSLVVRDKSGAIIAELVNNEWKVNPSRTWDRNYCENAVEVRAPNGEVVFQIRLVGNRAQLQAKLYGRDGQGIAFGKGIGPDGAPGGLIERTGPNRPDLTLKIDPLFRYPSDRHMGELLVRR